MEPKRFANEDPRSFETTLREWLELKQQMAQLHAQIEYVRLMLKLVARKPPT